MELFYFDLFLSGLTYVIIIYLAFRLMKSTRPKRGGNDPGDLKEAPPIIDLPPGVIWPTDSTMPKSKDRESTLV